MINKIKKLNFLLLCMVIMLINAIVKGSEVRDAFDSLRREEKKVMRCWQAGMGVSFITGAATRWVGRFFVMIEAGVSADAVGSGRFRPSNEAIRLLRASRGLMGSGVICAVPVMMNFLSAPSEYRIYQEMVTKPALKRIPEEQILLIAHSNEEKIY